MLYFFFTIVVLILLANTAREAKRNIWLWAIIGAVIWLGIYFLIGNILPLLRSNFGFGEVDETTFAVAASIANWLISLLAIFGLNKFLGRGIVREETLIEPETKNNS